MKTININEVNALAAWKKADKKEKQLLETLLGAELFNQKITDRVKTFEDAVAIIGATDNQKILLDYNGIDKDMLAARGFLQMTIVARALNEGWTPDWTNTSEWKYYPWFKMSGSGLSSDGYAYTVSITCVGSRLCFKTRELAEYAGKQFTAIYSDFFIL